MAFNANTYRANKCRKQAWDDLAEARAIKARVAAGTAYEWEKPRVAFFAKQARLALRISRNYRNIARMP